MTYLDDNGEQESNDGSETGRGKTKKIELQKGLAMAYNNGAIEYELLHKVGDAKNFFSKALSFAK